MIKNYFKITFRSLARNKVFSFINIFGLAIGLATCLLIMLYILDEASYDKHHQYRGRIFRVASVNEKGDTWAAAPGPLAWGLKNELPEVEQAARLLTFPDIESMLLKYEHNSESKQFFEPNGYYVDSTFFQVVSFDFTEGNPMTALNEPNSVVISKQLSQKFFGNGGSVGKLIRVNTPFGEFDYTVKGVFDNGINRSHIPANFFLSMRNQDMWNWVKDQTQWTTNNIFFTYIRLKEGADVRAFGKKLNPFFDGHAGADFKAIGISKSLFLQPIEGIYLHSSSGSEIGANGNITYLYILASIAVFVLLVACINFMNLSTARSQKRAKEVGVRKAIGAERTSLIRQFLGESFIMCGLALVLALILAWLFLPLFNNITQKNLHPLDQPVLIFWIVGLTLFTGLLSGLYPAFYLSAFKPVSVLKGKMLNSLSTTTVRKGLVVFQFTISICLILGSIVIWRQLTLFKKQQLGFNKNQKLVLPLQKSFLNSETNYVALKNELLKNPEIEGVTSGSSYPGIPNLSDMLFFGEGKTAKEFVDIHLSAIGDEYLETLGITLLSGRSFSKEFTGDSANIILNETAVKALGYEVADAVGKEIRFDFGQFQGAMRIIGVVKDFNFESLHAEIKPYGFTKESFGNKFGYTIVSLKTGNYSRVLDVIRKTWAKLNPEVPFVYSFLDQDFQRNYEKERQTSAIVGYFMVIAIFIACLGLFGLAAFSSEQRIKEIGVRKVLGASVTQVTALLSKEYIRLIIIAIVIGSPIAWYFMNTWLQRFAYRTSIDWWMFVLAGLLTVFVALITVSFQAIKAAIANPVKSLRTE